ncbi:hypothetical protein GCM10027053_52010 [Intrasporangium mesophilum]
MSVFKIVLLAWFALGLLGAISCIGKPRPILESRHVIRTALILGVASTMVVLS